ncbi:MAG: mannose-1-phosphate guanyltransferase [Acidithiobacillales bacterium SG8_45]|nr:MAG: mannose-1-phosphate guanyltransferase [Acidithiobacillales bacterium SG8_45]
MTSTRICPVILSGGSGTRLWPLSREHYPKQLLALTGERTLLQETAHRLDGIDTVLAPLVVCNEEHRFLVAEQLREVGVAPASIILEPVGRNTAPALALAAMSLLQQGEDPVMLVMPADHVIADIKTFQSVVGEGARLAADGRLVTFGIVPDYPATGYGYIKKGDGTDVDAFVEKPDLVTAQSYLDSGDYFWNSGLFMLKASVWMEELHRFRSDIAVSIENAYSSGTADNDFFRADQTLFRECPGDSIDYAVMEKTDRASVLPLSAGWSDIGAWSSLWEVSERDASGNVLTGDAIAHNTRDTMVVAQHRVVATVGLENMIVVETPDAVLVCHKEHAQDVKEIVNRLKDGDRTEHQMHRKVYRPWGAYEGVDIGERFQVKRLTVKPGAALSLQSHNKRAEHWVVVSGTAKVTRGDEILELVENESTYIPIGMKHRLENPGSMPLEIIEVQSGSYLGEDDIVRYEDIYNRVEKE